MRKVCKDIIKIIDSRDTESYNCRISADVCSDYWIEFSFKKDDGSIESITLKFKTKAQLNAMVGAMSCAVYFKENVG